jgi:hypothetical protein
MGVLGSAKSMLSVGETECDVAMWILPPAMMIKFQFKLAEGEAENLDKAGQKWREVAEKLQKTVTDLQDAVAGVPADAWSADDRTAYEQKVRQVCEQLEIAAQYYQAVGIALTGFAYALFAFAVFAVAMGTFVGALAAATAAAMAGVVTAVAVPEFEAVAATCLTITWGATAVLAAAGGMAAAVFQGGALLTAMQESAHGNKQAMSDFKHAEAVGAVTAVTNLAQNAINAGLDYANRTGGEKLPWMKTGPKGLPISSVDLDADRDKDNTWDVGGSATGKTPGGGEYTGGAHVKYGDNGWQGVEGEGEYKTSTGHTFGGKVGYEDEDGFGHGKSGTLSGEASYGYENEQSGQGYSGKVGGEYNVDNGDWKATGEGSYTSAGGQTFGGNAGYNSDGTISGGANYGYQNDQTGQGYSGGASGEYNVHNGDWKANGEGSYTSGGNTVSANGGYGSDGTVSAGAGYQNEATGAGGTYGGHYDPQTGQWVSE